MFLAAHYWPACPCRPAARRQASRLGSVQPTQGARFLTGKLAGGFSSRRRRLRLLPVLPGVLHLVCCEELPHASTPSSTNLFFVLAGQHRIVGATRPVHAARSSVATQAVSAPEVRIVTHGFSAAINVTPLTCLLQCYLQSYNASCAVHVLGSRRRRFADALTVAACAFKTPFASTPCYSLLQRTATPGAPQQKLQQADGGLVQLYRYPGLTTSKAKTLLRKVGMPSMQLFFGWVTPAHGVSVHCSHSSGTADLRPDDVCAAGPGQGICQHCGH